MGNNVPYWLSTGSPTHNFALSTTPHSRRIAVHSFFDEVLKWEPVLLDGNTVASCRPLAGA